MDELNLLHADAVKFGAGEDNTWFSAIDAKTLDRLITEMNEMNRWFAKVSTLVDVMENYEHLVGG